MARGFDAISAGSHEKPNSGRAAGGAPYEDVARVMAKLQVSGFTKINLITDTTASKPETRRQADRDRQDRPTQSPEAMEQSKGPRLG